MMKQLRYFFTMLLLAACSVVSATELTVSASALSQLKQGPPVVSEGFTFTVDKKDGDSKPTYNEKAGDYRIYAKGEFTIATTGATLSKIVFNISTAGLKRLAPITASTGTIAAQSAGDNTVVWTGSASSVTFTVGEKANYGSEGDSKPGQLDFTSLDLTYTGTPTADDPGTTPDDPSGDGYQTVTLPYTINFTKSQGEFVIEDVDLGGLSYVWTQTSNYGMKASAYNKQAYATESWLVSPLLDLTSVKGSVHANFDHAINNFTSPSVAQQEATVWVRTEGGSWQQLTDVNYPTTLSWNFVSSGGIDLSAYKGQKVQLGFKYTSTTAKAGTWEIKNFNIEEGAYVVTYQDETIESLSSQTSSISNVNLQLNNALVVYHDNTDGYFVREGDYAMLFYKTALPLTVGQTLTGSIKFDYAPYYNQPEVKDQEQTSLDDVVTGTAQVVPAVIEAADIPQATTHINDLVVVKDVALTTAYNKDTNENMYYIETYDSDGTPQNVRLYNRFKLSDVFPTNIIGSTFDVIGILNINNNTRRVFPISIKTAGSDPTAISQAAQSQTDDAIYTLQGVRVEKAVKGTYIVGGKKIIVR